MSSVLSLVSSTVCGRSRSSARAGRKGEKQQRRNSGKANETRKNEVAGPLLGGKGSCQKRRKNEPAPPSPIHDNTRSNACLYLSGGLVALWLAACLPGLPGCPGGWQATLADSAFFADFGDILKEASSETHGKFCRLGYFKYFNFQMKTPEWFSVLKDFLLDPGAFLGVFFPRWGGQPQITREHQMTREHQTTRVHQMTRWHHTANLKH